jgi:hypothetical protein
MAVFECVVYQCHALTTERPERPVLEVDAILREGDAEGELLLPVPMFMALLGGPAEANDALRQLAAGGRLVDHEDVTHIRFPMWERVPPDD